MLQSGIANIINKALGEFLEENTKFSQDIILLGITKGSLSLSNLTLKSKVLDALRLPFNLILGSIGNIDIKFPLNIFSNEPITIVINRIFLSFEPRYSLSGNERQKWNQEVKRAALRTAEIVKEFSIVKLLQFGIQKHLSKFMLEHIAKRLLRNIKIQLNEIHLRYEDPITCPMPLCLGMTIESISLENMGDALANNVNSPENILKLIQIENFAIYWNPILSATTATMAPKTTSATAAAVTSSLSNLDTNTTIEMMQKGIAKRSDNSSDLRRSHHYIIEPLQSVFLEISLNLTSLDVTVIN